MKISLKIHTLAIWKFFVIVLIAIFLLIILLNEDSKIRLVFGLSFLILSVISFFVIREKYLVFHKSEEVENQTKKVFGLLSLDFKQNEVNYFYVKKFDLRIKILNLGIASMISFMTNNESKETKYLETTILKYQYAL